MCLVLIAHHACRGYPLIVVANRDEFHARATATADWWTEHPNVFGGRDLDAGGTWLAVDRTGRFATLTNVRSGTPTRARPRSRGLLLNDFLTGSNSARRFLDVLEADADDYAGFNMLTRDQEALCWLSNHGGPQQTLPPGIYTVSNALLDTPWPKAERLKQRFLRVMQEPGDDLAESLLRILCDHQRPADDSLPQTGIGLVAERALSSVFISGEHYGTRCSTVVLIDDRNRLHFYERSFDHRARVTEDVRVAFELAEPAP